MLTSINEVFLPDHDEKSGEYSYTKETALHPGAVFQETEGRAGEKTELLLIHGSSEQLKQLDEDSADYTARKQKQR